MEKDTDAIQRTFIEAVKQQAQSMFDGLCGLGEKSASGGEPLLASVYYLAASHLIACIEDAAALSEAAALFADLVENAGDAALAAPAVACDVAFNAAIGHARADVDYFLEDFAERAPRALEDSFFDCSRGKGEPIPLSRGTGPERMAARHEVLETAGDNALVRTSEGGFAVAFGYDAETRSWSHGSYFSAGDLLGAACELHGVKPYSKEDVDELLSGYIAGATADTALLFHPELTRDEAEAVAKCANDNLSSSCALHDLVDDQIDAEVESLMEKSVGASQGPSDVARRATASAFTSAHKGAEVGSRRHL